MRTVAERVLGPHLASRLGDGRDALGADRLGLSREVRDLVAGLFAAAGGLGSASVVITTFFADEVPDYRPGLIAVSTLACLLAAQLTRPLWATIGPRPLILHGLLLGATVLATLASWASGPEFAPFGMVFYIWCPVTAACCLHLRGTLLHLVFIAAGCALVLALLEPVSSPVSRWLLIVGTCVFSGVLVDRFCTRIQTTALEEAEARDHAEEMSAHVAEASRHKSAFLAAMSHELRTPLNAVIGFSDVLFSKHFGDLTDEQEEYVRDIRDSGQHLLALINDVLDLSKVEAGKLELDRRWFDVTECVQASVCLVQLRADSAGIRIVVDIEDPTIEVFGDERRIKQVLVNLLNNAVKFTPSGGSVTVSVRAVDSGVEIAVADTGVGIAPEDQASIFENFRQVGDADLAREGSGLGLALAQQILEIHGGAIEVSSVPGSGSTFTCLIPCPSDRTAESLRA